MKKMKMTVSKSAVLILVVLMLAASMAGCAGIKEVPADKEYTFTNPEPVVAQPDAGFKIDGVADEAAYQDAKWLYLNNDGEGNNVTLAVTSHFGQQGMYFVFDVTESFPIYVNPDRSSVLNSGVELYLAPAGTQNHKENNFFEIDLQPTGDMIFKMSNGKWGYVEVKSTDDKMAQLGATTKGGAVNTEECYGYVLELFIPWDYLEWLDIDVEKMKDHALVNIAHITSFNYAGTNVDIDRYWYQFIEQIGGSFTEVNRFFKFDANGAVGTIPVTFVSGEHYTVSGQASVLSGKSAKITVTPEDGYAITSLLVDGVERIGDAGYNNDGVVTLTITNVTKEVTVSAVSEAITEGNKTLGGQVKVHSIFDSSLAGVTFTCNGDPVKLDENGNFQMKDLAPGYYELRAEKSGCVPFVRGIYLSRDCYVEVVLEYDLFYYSDSNNKNWLLDDQNDGIVYKTNGRSHILSNVSFEDFAFAANVKFDAALASTGTDANATEQRMGIRIKFSNGKTWCIHVLYQGGRYFIQYAPFGESGNVHGDSKWVTAYTLNASQISKYQSAEGIELKVVRHGSSVNIYLGDTLVKQETLAAEYADLSAQLGLDAWIANAEPMAVSFDISGTVAD